MSAQQVGCSAPNVYWDRADKVVRDLKTGMDLPQYEGLCLVYRDVEGPTLVNTFLSNGERLWEGSD